MAMRECRSQSAGEPFVRSSPALGSVVRKVCVALLAFALLIGAYANKAQDITGRIAGTVTDSSGDVMPTVTVTIINEATLAQRPLETDKLPEKLLRVPPWRLIEGFGKGSRGVCIRGIDVGESAIETLVSEGLGSFHLVQTGDYQKAVSIDPRRGKQSEAMDSIVHA